MYPAPREYNLERGHQLRANRFISISKPRSIERTCCDDLIDDYANEGLQKITYAQYDLEPNGVYDIETLDPAGTKHYKNLDAYPYVFET